jgi:CO dehydrogenase maturation factor
MGNLTRDFLNHIQLQDNEVILVDTSAGIEHIGRGVIESADKLITIVDPSSDAILLANKIEELSKKASKEYEVIINKVDENTKTLVEQQLNDDINIIGSLEYDPSIAQSNLTQTEINSIEIENAITKICENI